MDRTIIKRGLSLLLAVVFAFGTTTITVGAQWEKNPQTGTWSYTDGGAYTGWNVIDGKWYYFDDHGIMQTGWQQLENQWYYLAGDGAMRTQWFQYGDSWYFANYSGVMQTGWVKYGNSWYYFVPNGEMQTGWISYGNAWYYADKNGELQTGWVQLGDAWYYFVPNGEMQTGWISYGKSWYFADTSGLMQTGTLQIDGSIYYFDASGQMQTGIVTIDGTNYTFKTSGEAYGKLPKPDKVFGTKPPIPKPDDESGSSQNGTGGNNGSGTGSSNSGTTDSEQTEFPSGTSLYVRLNGGAPQHYDRDELLARIVAYEMSPSFEPEALKAQVVAAHTYILAHNLKGNPASVGGVNTEPAQAIKDAVAQVGNQVIYYNDVPIAAFYCASSAGYTADVKNVWGSTYPYLVSVESKYDNLDPNWASQTVLSQEQVAQMVFENLGIVLGDDASTWFEIQRRVDGQYVSSVTIGGEYTTSGRALRESILVQNGRWYLKSAAFEIETTENDIIFTTYGYGHGVGMSQNGANLYAKVEGWTYDQILTHYYPGTQIQS